MNKLWLVIRREYLERVRSKWFLIGTILGPLFMSAMILAPLMVQKLSAPTRKIAIVDAANDAALSNAIVAKLQAKKGQASYQVEQQTAADPAALSELQKQLAKRIDEDSLQGYLLISRDSVKNGQVDYFSRNVSDFLSLRQIESAANGAIVERRLKDAGMDAARVAELSKPIDLKTNKLVETGVKEESGQSFVLAYVMMFIIYFTMVLYGVSVLRGVVEEKQNRIVEVIVSSISPLELMFGKLIGIGLVGLTQFAIWSTFALLLPIILASFSIAAGNSLPDIPKSLLVYFILYFILGYFLYATLYAMAGSLVSSEQDTNTVQMPITILLVISSVFSSMVVSDPNSTPATVLSLIPFFSPILMFMRITIQTPPFWQIALSIVLMVITIVICSWIAGKIYRVGILMYGKRPNLPELLRWLRYT